MNSLTYFIKQILEKRYLLYQLTKRDFISKYVDSYLGLAWAVLEPLATTLILSLIFSFGFRAGLKQDVPFFVYMFTGMVAFNFFSKAAGEGANVIQSYSFLVKKVNFKLFILPVMKNISCSIFHLIMLMLLIVVLIYYGFYPSWYWLQFFYYFFAMNLLVLGFTWLTSSISVFVPDVRHLVTLGMQFFFYLSPVFWSIENIPEKWAILPKLNPMYYIINGYRDSFIYSKPFWEHIGETIYFWSVTFILLVVGTTVFRKLRPQFADVI